MLLLRLAARLLSIALLCYGAPPGTTQLSVKFNWKCCLTDDSTARATTGGKWVFSLLA